MATRTWAPGEFITPGDLRQPLTAPPVVTSAIPNNSFETGDLTDWTVSDPAITVVDMLGGAFQGTYAVKHPDGLLGAYTIESDNVVPVTPGQVITAYIRYRRETNVNGRQAAAVEVVFYDSGMVDLIAEAFFNQSGGATNVWYSPAVTAIAPVNAAFARLRIRTFQTGDGGTHHQYFDDVGWDYVAPVPAAGLVFRAVQANAGFTGATEPVWPTTLGDTVVDNEVTWEAVVASNVTWEATPILLSGAVEPTFPTEVGATVLDNTVVWKAVSRRVLDESCPNSKAVAIAASKVFGADDDIIRFCATVNPLDWTTRDDAGYLPFGLQTYGSNPVAALGLYRSNLVAFNSQGFQMWQVDQDPANMAFLDAVPVGSVYTRTWKPVANDLLGMTAVGVRNISIAGASTNLQADGVGEPVDAIIKPLLRALESTDDAFGLFWPAAGQFWAVLGTDVIVLTINGAKKKSWSRYTFPEAITDWTLDGDTLVLRAGDHVWEVDDEVLGDDQFDVSEDFVSFDAEADGAYIGVSSGPTFTPIPAMFGNINSLNDDLLTSRTFVVTEDGTTLTIGTAINFFGSPVPPDADYFEEILVIDNLGNEFRFASADATTELYNDDQARSWSWPIDSELFEDGSTYTIYFLTDVTSTPIVGTVQWPYLDMGAVGLEKQLVGMDLVCTAPTGVSVSIGYNQNDRSQRTADYEVDADTLTGQMVPFPVSGPSFDLKLTFAAGQTWEWQAANLYVNDWRRGA